MANITSKKNTFLRIEKIDKENKLVMQITIEKTLNKR